MKTCVFYVVFYTKACVQQPNYFYSSITSLSLAQAECQHLLFATLLSYAFCVLTSLPKQRGMILTIKEFTEWSPSVPQQTQASVVSSLATDVD